MTLHSPTSSGSSDVRSEPATASAGGDPARACTPRQLASLGPLLCLYPLADSHVLSGYHRATSAQSMVSVGSDGPREALLFFDRMRQPCWRLYLLPDSDCLAWEQAISGLPAAAAPTKPWPADDDGWAPIRRVLRNRVWRACALRLHAVASPPYRLATSAAMLSAAGQRAAQRIVKAVGAEAMHFLAASRA